LVQDERLMRLSIYAEERKFGPRLCQGSGAAGLTQNLHRFDVVVVAIQTAIRIARAIGFQRV
jgi:hypothetical protein